MQKLILPKLGAHMSERKRRDNPHEIHAAPFPEAHTTEEILAIANEVERQGYGIVGQDQRPLRLRAPKPGEKAVVVGLTTDQPADEDPTVFFFTGVHIATGTPSSRLWYTGSEYPYLGSMEALQKYLPEHRDAQRLNAQIATDVMRQRKRQRYPR